MKRHGGLLVSALDTASSSLGSGSLAGDNVVFLGKTLLVETLKVLLYSTLRCINGYW